MGDVDGTRAPASGCGKVSDGFEGIFAGDRGIGRTVNHQRIILRGLPRIIARGLPRIIARGVTCIIARGVTRTITRTITRGISITIIVTRPSRTGGQQLVLKYDSTGKEFRDESYFEKVSISGQHDCRTPISKSRVGILAARVIVVGGLAEIALADVRSSDVVIGFGEKCHIDICRVPGQPGVHVGGGVVVPADVPMWLALDWE